MSPSAPNRSECPACGATGGFREFSAREMQLGLREEFKYLECSRCGTIQIAVVPEDLGRYYPRDYYAYAPPSHRKGAPGWLRRLAAHWLIASPDPVAAAVANALSYRRFAFFQWSRRTGARFRWRILDIGCGSGGLLRRMKSFGFRDLTGIDPYGPDSVREPGLTLLRAERPPSGNAYDLIMMNHVLEHMPDPASGLEAARNSLSSRGRLLVRVPLAGSFAHRKYGTHWYHLDAPRHLVIPSLEGMRLLGERAGLRLLASWFDGEEASFLMSESYAKGFPARHAPRPNRRTRVRYRRWAHRLNTRGEGDLGVFVFTR